VYRNFSFESIGEIILKIGAHLPKLLSNIKWLTFLRQYIGMVKFHNHGVVQAVIGIPVTFARSHIDESLDFSV